MAGTYQVYVETIVPVVISLHVLKNIGSKIKMYKFQFSLRTNETQFYYIVVQLCYFFFPICWDERISSILVIVHSSSLQVKIPLQKWEVWQLHYSHLNSYFSFQYFLPLQIIYNLKIVR